MDLVQFYSGVTIISINYYKFRPIFRRRGSINKRVERKVVAISSAPEASPKISEFSKKKKKRSSESQL